MEEQSLGVWWSLVDGAINWSVPPQMTRNHITKWPPLRPKKQEITDSILKTNYALYDKTCLLTWSVPMAVEGVCDRIHEGFYQFPLSHQIQTANSIGGQNEWRCTWGWTGGRVASTLIILPLTSLWEMILMQMAGLALLGWWKDFCKSLYKILCTHEQGTNI